MLEFIDGYDLVIIQRCYIYSIIKQIHDYCQFLGKPLIFEVDDDYLHLPPTNPAYFGDFIPPGMEKAPVQDKELHRENGLEGYRKALELVDLITVSTEELKRTLYPYNKNIEVLPNNVERIYRYTSHGMEAPDPNNPGKLLPVEDKHGLVNIPDHYLDGWTKKLKNVVRIGYSGTVTHQEDFKSIQYYWKKLIDKYSCKKDKAYTVESLALKREKIPLWFVYIGDPYFFKLHSDESEKKGLENRHHWVKPASYDMYIMQIRNLDVGIAPLAPDIFNMSKSPIKAIEAGSWGIPSVLPNYITYSREFTHGKNCFLYKSGQEFFEYMDLLIGDDRLRFEMGQAAQQYVAENRLEYQHSEKRFKLYDNLVKNSYPLKTFVPNKELNAA